MDREHRLQARAEKVAALLEALWGDLPPVSPNPQLTALIDAVAGDDEHGRLSQVVVHGDGLTYTQLAQALLDTGPRSAALAKIPPRLLQQLIVTGVIEATISPGMAALPDEHCGAWELEAGTNTVSYDATCARLLGVGHAAGQGPFPLQLTVDPRQLTPGPLPFAVEETSSPRSAGTNVGAETAMRPVIHPHDQPVVVAALVEALGAGGRYETRFRVRLADGTWAWRASRARVLPATGTTARRLVGFLAADDDAFVSASSTPSG